MRVVALAAILYNIVVVALILICGTGIQGGALHQQDYPSVSFQGGALQAPKYPSITFNLKGATWQTYRDFIEELREIVTRGATTIAGTSLPVLNRVVPDSRRFVYVHLINTDGNDVTFAVDVTNLYVVAFSANNNAYFLDSEEIELRNLFVGINRDPVGFTGNYNDLERVAGAGRGSIPLGPAPLNKAIKNLPWLCIHPGRWAVSWMSVKQKCVADSTTEAEYVAASEASKEAAWLRKFLMELGVVPEATKPIVLFCDNSGAVANSKEPRYTKGMRHVERKYHLVRELEM